MATSLRNDLLLGAINIDFKEYIVFVNGQFQKNKRQEFLDQIRKDFDVKDNSVNYSRCHSVSYSSIVSSVVKAFNMIYKVKNGIIKDIPHDEAIYIVAKYLSGLILAVKKSPLIITDDYKSISIANYYSNVLNEDDIEKGFVSYAVSKNLILKLILRLLNNSNNRSLVDNMLDFGNILIEKLNNCHMNLRSGPAKYNSFVSDDYDIISFASCNDGIIIDNEMDCCALSHVKHLMYPLEDTIKYLAPRSIVVPQIYVKNGNYEVMTSFQLCDNNKGNLGAKASSAKVYINDWYTKDKELITF